MRRPSVLPLRASPRHARGYCSLKGGAEQIAVERAPVTVMVQCILMEQALGVRLQEPVADVVGAVAHICFWVSTNISMHDWQNGALAYRVRIMYLTTYSEIRKNSKLALGVLHAGDRRFM